MGRLDEALALARSALAGESKLPSPSDRARLLRITAAIHLDLGHLAEARSYYDRSLRVLEQAGGRDEADIADTLHRLALVDRRERRYADARARLERAVPIFARLYGEEKADTLFAAAELADMLLATGEPAPALAIYRRLLPPVERLLGRDNPRLILILTPMGQALDRVHRPDEARPLLERALRMVPAGAPPTDLAEIRFSVARVLPPSDRARAARLAAQALAAYRAAGPAFRAEAADVRAWLRAAR
jgi:tetratricopeptide (TPR) repeat protein